MKLLSLESSSDIVICTCSGLDPCKRHCVDSVRDIRFDDMGVNANHSSVRFRMNARKLDPAIKCDNIGW